MGRSGASCFKIIACGGSSESVDRDDLDASSENKGSDKRGWSFRKRSARHRLLSNSVITEIPSSENKESSEPPIVNSDRPVNSTVSEKPSGNQWTEEMPRLSTSTTKEATISTVVNKAEGEDEIKLDIVPDESVIIVIQACLRRFLAQRELLRRKKVVMLQAAVRGQLIRNHAVGSLRCVLAIVKMQALVRARRANLSAVGDEGAQDPGTKRRPTYISIEKLLNNRFALKLLDSTPRTKQMKVRCDPSRSDSAWKWMERWMSVSSPGTFESQSPKQEKYKVDNTENQAKTETPNRELTNMKPDIVEKPVLSDAKEKVICSEEPSITGHDEEKHQPVNTFVPDQNSCLNTGDQKELNSIPTIEQPKRPAKRVATESADSEGRKSVFGSRKASNPAFIAAQSRFEELSSKSNSLKSVNSSNQNNAVDSSAADTGSSAPENAPLRARDVEPVESLVPQISRVVQIGGSECGTELSITSTLDSPDQSDVGNMEFEKEARVLDNVNIEEHALLGTELTYPVSVLPEKHDGANGSEREQTKSSPDASPKSHTTVPESHGTPSSQLSNTHKTTSHKKTWSQKRKAWSHSNKSPATGLRRSLEHLPKDPKHGKRRNSFGSQCSDHNDQEPRDSSCSNNTPLPSYMQATESARAKALAEVQSREVHMKKRHSLPGAVNRKANGSQEKKWQR